MKIGERNLAFSFRFPDTNDRFERSERDTHVAWMGGDALVTLTENGVDPVVTINGAAAAAGIAFVARRKCRVIKIVTACSLQKIAADGCHVAQLRTRARKQGFAQNRITRFDQ